MPGLAGFDSTNLMQPLSHKGHRSSWYVQENGSSFMWSRQPLPTDRKQIALKQSQDNVSGDNCNSELAGFLFQIPKKARNTPDSKCICQSGKQNEQTFQGGKPTQKKASKKIHIYSVDANVQMLRQPLKTAHLIAS